MREYKLISTINENTKQGFQMRFFIDGKRVSQIKFKLVCMLAEEKSEAIHKQVGQVDKYYMSVYY